MHGRGLVGIGVWRGGREEEVAVVVVVVEGAEDKEGLKTGGCLLMLYIFRLYLWTRRNKGRRRRTEGGRGLVGHALRSLTY